ncbi:allatostatin receptor 1 [Penaeus vannamei]|uniref:Allatostatin receptor 1 n=1 Tax=Penaeus vannamei TaxID=6689 RepID=A0A3R7MNZ6_PENVA|nr:somatostatin receptor type 2-like [Penaeus vannamei]ROT66478.1 allatostatin receptor 1 [Penaeus vannamei]
MNDSIDFDQVDANGSFPLNCTYLNAVDREMEHNCSLGLFTGDGSSIHMVTNIIMQACYAVAFLVGLCGNTLVIYVVTRFSKMQTVTNLYIVNLAIADELFVVGIPFLMMTSAMGYWAFGSIMCKLYMITTSLNQFTSSLFLTIMSADRYIAVCHPISSNKFRTPMISKLVSLTAWTISALMIVPVFMYSNTLKVNDLINCNIFWPDGFGVSGQFVFTLYSFILAFGIPLVLIFIFYSLVLHKLKTVGPKAKSKEKKKSHRKVTKMVLTVITVYVLCWLPYWVLQLALIFSPPREGQSSFMIVLFLISSCLSYINSAINPILYAFLSDNFKKSFMKACICAARKDVNSALTVENSVFPRRRGGSSNPRGGGGKGGATDLESNDAFTTHDIRDEPTTAITMTTRSSVSQVAKENGALGNSQF